MAKSRGSQAQVGEETETPDGARPPPSQATWACDELPAELAPTGVLWPFWLRFAELVHGQWLWFGRSATAGLMVYGCEEVY